MKIRTNAGEVKKKYRTRLSRIEKAQKLGLRRIVAKVDKYQVENLSGSNEAAPGSYPVPDRSGTLLRGHFFQVRSAHLALAGNTAAHAHAIHSGKMTTRDGRDYSLRPREFLDKAAEKVDHLEIMATTLRTTALAV